MGSALTYYTIDQLNTLLAQKMDIVSNGTAGDIVVLSDSGDSVDSGVNPLSLLFGGNEIDGGVF